MTEKHKPRFCGEFGATVVSVAKFCSACGTDLIRFEVATVGALPEQPSDTTPAISNVATILKWDGHRWAPDEITPDEGNRSSQTRPNDGLVVAYRTLGLRVQSWTQHEGSPSHLGRFLMRSVFLAIRIVNLVCLVMMALDRDHLRGTTRPSAVIRRTRWPTTTGVLTTPT